MVTHDYCCGMQSGDEPLKQWIAGDAPESPGTSLSDIELENPNTTLLNSNPNLRIGIIPAGSTDTVVVRCITPYCPLWTCSLDFLIDVDLSAVQCNWVLGDSSLTAKNVTIFQQFNALWLVGDNLIIRHLGWTGQEQSFDQSVDTWGSLIFSPCFVFAVQQGHVTP